MDRVDEVMERVTRLRAELADAEAERVALLIELTGDAAKPPPDLVRRLGFTGWHAGAILRTHRAGRR